ncbi:anti-sigma factor [Paenibacillus tepidiphilus]|uniref:anti-sigma factor n=1 Tax=Paenibacillus tepidiphilus TaxID=2608683 RepID=UPI0013A52D45|nr:anti-sigma factor [Paenibacillus tepidiphilus]
MNRSVNGKIEPFPVRHYSEEEWIDWIEGAFAGDRQQRMQQHLEDCPACAATVRTWRPLLEPSGLTEGRSGVAGRGVTGSGAAGSGAAGSGAAGSGAAGYSAEGSRQTAGGNQDRTPASLPMPSGAVRKSLRLRVRYIGWRRRLRNRWTLYRGGAAALILCGALFLLLRGLYSPEDSSAERTRYVSSYEPQALAVMSRPETVSYALDRAGRDQFSGNVWYNGDSGELFVLIDDIALSDKLSLQAWMIKNGRRDPLGLLRIEAAKGHLYIKDGQLGDAENFALTVEPVGGSRAPTSPDAVWLPLPKP